MSLTFTIEVFTRYATHWEGSFTKREFLRSPIPELLKTHGAKFKKTMKYASASADVYVVTFSDVKTGLTFRKELTQYAKLLHPKVPLNWCLYDVNDWRF